MTRFRIRQPSVVYCGHVIRADGLQADPDKIKAVQEMPSPNNKEALRRFLGFVTYLEKFIPNLSQQHEPLRQLLKAENQFQWQNQHEKPFKLLKKLCTEAPNFLMLTNQLKPLRCQLYQTCSMPNSKRQPGCILFKSTY
ncbi:Pol polyprotein [Plakobranchus ocellatus]|uniref:Pol polyprotein n=1 Tax=Plakobranchus ocellatus TaxID=259542 RepID=A0AAV4CIQ8_9GAST|nr:Pol polyprotein [Plakobranchus ocellatus]